MRVRQMPSRDDLKSVSKKEGELLNWEKQVRAGVRGLECLKPEIDFKRPFRLAKPKPKPSVTED